MAAKVLVKVKSNQTGFTEGPILDLRILKIFGFTFSDNYRDGDRSD